MEHIPLPRVDNDNKRYFSPESGLLEVPRCQECGAWNFYPRTHCRQCLSGALEWASTSPTGTVYSFAIIHRPQHKAFFDTVPHTMVVADMDDGFQLIASLEHAFENVIMIGDRVKVYRYTIDNNQGLSIPMFKLLKLAGSEAQS